MSVPTPLRAAVLGLGWAGTVHARALATMRGVELVAIADPDPARRAQFPGLPTVAGLPEVIARRPDYCVVATPTATHEPLGLALAAAGIPTLIEKPLAPNAAAAARIADAFAAAGLPAAVGHTERHNPATAELARLVHSDAYGPTWQITTRRQSPYPGRITDVGVVYDTLIHDLDLAAWVGRAPIASVTAITARTGNVREDVASVTAVLQHGVLAYMHADWLTPVKRRILEVHCAAGVLTADAIARTLTLYPNTAPPRSDGRFPGVSAGDAFTLPVPETDQPFTLENRFMRDLLLGAPTGQPVTLAEGAAAVAAADAVLAAAADPNPMPVTRCEPVEAGVKGSV